MLTLSKLARPVLVILAALSAIQFCGCPYRSNSAKHTSTPPKAKRPLTVLVVDDPQLGQAIAREWRARTEEGLKVQEATMEQLATAHRLPADAVVFSSGMVGQLVERGLIQPIDLSVLDESDFNNRDIFDQLRLREMKWGNRTVALPLGSPQLVLAYRADIFEKVGVQPPVDWAEYQRLVERLADRSLLGDLSPPADQPWRATAEPLADGWAGQTLLARAAAYALHRDQISPLFQYDSLAPLIDQPPYVWALGELVATAKSSDLGDQRLSPSQAMEELLAGRCAMALTWPAPGPASAVPSQAQKGKLGFALLPGGKRAYRFATKTWEDRGEEDSPHVPVLAVAGRMAAVSSSTADVRRAEGFVFWLASREVASAVGPQSQATTMARSSQVADVGRWAGWLGPDAARRYADALAETMALPRAFPGLRLPGRLEYLAALDAAVLAAVAGEKTPAEALGEAAVKWRAITERIGVEQQRRANARSLGQQGL